LLVPIYNCINETLFDLSLRQFPKSTPLSFGYANQFLYASALHRFTWTGRSLVPIYKIINERFLKMTPSHSHSSFYMQLYHKRFLQKRPYHSHRSPPPTVSRSPLSSGALKLKLGQFLFRSESIKTSPHVVQNPD